MGLAMARAADEYVETESVEQRLAQLVDDEMVNNPWVRQPI